MTVLKSLLSTFRRSRSDARKSRRKAQVSQHTAGESLEPRLLLTNPDPFSSLQGAPVTVYLDFDGHTDAQWTGQRRDGLSGRPIVTPEFDFDGSAAFNRNERERIEEIWGRVAEDFSPFNINVTTVDPGLPFDNDNNSQALLVSIGGNGSWTVPTGGNELPPRFRSDPNGFSGAGFNTAFVFQSTNAQLGGGDAAYEQNIAASVSQAIATAMGLQQHVDGNGDLLEGDVDVAPILGDQIPGSDASPANAVSERDIWFNAPVDVGGANQDDLARIVGNAGVTYRNDLHGNTDSSATGITVTPLQEVLTGVIGRNTDVDVFSFATRATDAIITVTGIDYTSIPFSAASPGSNLDPTLTIRDAAGTVIDTDNGAGLSATISTPLADGLFYIEVSNGGEYGNLGQYTLTIDGVNQLPIFSNPVALSSNPGASVDFYLSFAGDNIAASNPILNGRQDGGSGSLVIPAYDTDNNPGAYSATEINEITEIWARVAEDFRPFDVNVTTIRPGSIEDGFGAQVTIGGDGAFLGNPLYEALLRAYDSPNLPNQGFVFSERTKTGSADDAHHIAFMASSAFGKMLGLNTHPSYDFFGNLQSPLDAGTAAIGPILGNPRNSLRDVWVTAPDSIGPGSVQDDISIISGQLGFRPDDHSDFISGANTISVDVGDELIQGVISETTDVDVFRFNTLATTATISVTGLDLIQQFPGVTNPGSNLDPVLQLLDAQGGIIEENDFPVGFFATPAGLKASITRDLPAGSYYIRVSNRGEYGNVGEYTITLQGVDVNPLTIEFNPDTFFENDGLQTGVGIVRRPEGELFGPEIVVDLASADLSEATVTPQVTIQASAAFATFDITLVDDDLLDGDQRTGITASINGVLNAQGFITVQDHETVSATLIPNPIDEDSGTVQLTVARSNRDTGAPNHWVVTNNTLEEYTVDGTFVNSVPVEWPDGNRPAVDRVHDITIMEDGRIAVFNGTLNSYVSVFNPGNDSWNHIGPIAGLGNSTADLSTGGISSVGDYVFLSDIKSNQTDLTGLVRVDVNTGRIDRFGDRIVGARIFALQDTVSSSGPRRTILEFDPTNGDLLNTITLQVAADVITFDGTHIWVAVRAPMMDGNDQLLKIDPDSGEVLETHPLGALVNSQFEGLVHLDGLMYLFDAQNDFDLFANTVGKLAFETYDPVTRQVVGTERQVESVQVGSTEFGSFFGALPESNVLLATDERQSVVYHIDPISGAVVDQFVAQTYPLGAPTGFAGYIGTGPGITSIRDVNIDGINYPELIYVKSAPREFDIYTPEGTQIDADPDAPGVNPLEIEVDFNGDVTGDDVPGVTSATPEFRDVTVGLDGRVYGLNITGTEISIHDPETFNRLDIIALGQAVRTISVGDGSGIYGGTTSGEVVLFDFTGTTLATATTSLGVITDIEVNLGQEVLISDAGGQVLLTSQAAVAAGDLSSATVLENTGGLSFISFGRHRSRSTGNLVVSLQSDDLTELIVPATVTIPVNQSEVTIDVQIVDDNERDGDQTVNLITDSPEYVSTASTIIVADVENVGVDVIPDEVPEGGEVLPGIVRVYRTDVDGPLDFASTLNVSNTTRQPITDNAVSLSTITVPDQVSRITDLNVTLNLTHDAIPDLDVFLISPQGTRIELFSDLSSNESNLTNTELDDQASQRIVDAEAPFTGSFIPEQFLENLNGENPSGTWTLEIIDDSRGDAGNLENWSMEIATIGLSALTVNLSSSDREEALPPVTVTIPENTFEIYVPLEVFDDNELDGTQTVTIAVDDTDLTPLGFRVVNDTVDVTDNESLSVVLSSTTVSEGAGQAAIQGTISRTTTAGALSILLTSSDTSELTVPATVTIPDGEISVTFDVNAIDDTEFDGDQLVTLSVAAPGYLVVTTDPITVQDQEPRLQLSTVTPTVAEDAGTVIFTVTRRDASDLSVAQRVAVTSSDPSEVTVPATVIIRPGETSTSFTATIVEDTELDGTQAVTITATDIDVANPAVNSATFDLNVEDAEFISLTVPEGLDTLLENTGDGAVTVTVSISSLGHTVPIVVALTNSDQTELSIPASVVIPVDTNSTTFLLNVLDDPKIDRDQLVTITGSVDGYRDGILKVTVEDHEPPVLTGPTLNTVDPTPVFAWAAVDGATRYDLWVNDVSRNINQLFRLENRTATAPLFKETFEADGGFDEAGWVANNSEVDDLAIGEQGSFSAHLNGNPTGGDQLTSRDVSLAGEIGVQLTYSYQRTGTLDSPGPGQDLVLQYRNADGDWIELERQLGVEPDMTVFRTSVVELPEEALHQTFAFRFISFGDPEVEVEDEDAGDTVDDWFVDDITIAGYEKFEPTQELGVGHYRFWVRAYDDLEQPGVWSNDRNFRVRTAPVFTSPVETVTIAETTFPQISWTSVVDTDRYDLWINNMTTGESQVVRESNLQTTSFASSTAGLPGGTYRAWTRAIAPDLNPNDQIAPVAGRWSSPVVFTVLSTPQNIAPSGATFDRTPEITWDAVEGATNYDVWVTHRIGPGNNPIVLRDRFVSGTSRTPDTDFEIGNYVVWVRAVAEDGSRSQWSDAVSFSVGGRPEVTSPSEGAATASTPIITWSGIGQSDFYQIWINNSAGERVVFETNVQATSFAIQQALPADSYRVWVRAVSDMGEFSFWSNAVSFTVVAADTDGAPQNALPPTVDLMLARFEAPSDLTPSPANAVLAPAVVVQEELVEEPEPVMAAVGHTTAIPVTTDESDSKVEEAVDSIMAEWDGADWWNDVQTAQPDEDASFAAAAVGVIAAGASVRTTSHNRKRNK